MERMEVSAIAQRAHFKIRSAHFHPVLGVLIRHFRVHRLFVSGKDFDGFAETQFFPTILDDSSEVLPKLF